MFVRSLLVSVLAAGLLCGQESKPLLKQENYEATIIPVKTLSGDSFDRLYRMLGVFNTRITADDKLRTIIVYAPKEVAEQVKRVVAELDKPGSEAAIGRNMEMTLTLLRCGLKPGADSKPLPADMEPVAKQIRAATQYKEIQLWDVVPLHLQEGKRTEQSMRLPGALADAPGAFPTMQISIQPASVSRRDSGRYVRFESVRINFRIPYLTMSRAQANAQFGSQFTYNEVGLNTAGDFKEGQKSVLGKVSGSEEETAIFVVISLKVLD